MQSVAVQTYKNYEHLLIDGASTDDTLARAVASGISFSHIVCEKDSETTSLSVSFSLLKQSLISARVDISEISRYSASSTQGMLDKLLAGGYISASEYVKHLPAGLISGREELVALLEEKEAREVSRNA